MTSLTRPRQHHTRTRHHHHPPPPLPTGSTSVTTTLTTTSRTSAVSTTTPVTPDPVYCNVKGDPLGVYYLGTFVENRNNVPVTLEGCYQFCQLYAAQCDAYHFYHAAGLGPFATRCDLYGATLPYVLESVDNTADGVWFDRGCGNPEAYT